MKPADIVILAGQSNAVGVGHTKYLPRHFSEEKVREYLAGYPGVQLRYFSHDKKNTAFEPVCVNQTEVTKDTFGPEVGMAEYFTGHYPDREVFIVKCAFGGMSLWRDFRSPSCGGDYDPDAFADQYEDMINSVFAGKPVRAGWCYNELVKLLRESIAALEAAGYTPRVRAFCWMQGESDGSEEATTAQYIGLYDAMLRDLAAAFPGYMDGCISVDAGISAIWPFYKEINAAKQDYARAHGFRYIDTVAAGLTTANEPEEEPDIYHYDADCVIRLGQLFAQQVPLD